MRSLIGIQHLKWQSKLPTFITPLLNGRGRQAKADEAEMDFLTSGHAFNEVKQGVISSAFSSHVM